MRGSWDLLKRQIQILVCNVCECQKIKRKAIKLLWAKLIPVVFSQHSPTESLQQKNTHTDIQSPFPTLYFATWIYLTLARCFSIYFSSRCCFVSIKLISFRYTCAILCASQLIVLRDVLHIVRTLASFVDVLNENVFVWKLHFSSSTPTHRTLRRCCWKKCVDVKGKGENEREWETESNEGTQFSMFHLSNL